MMVLTIMRLLILEVFLKLLDDNLAGGIIA